MQDYGQQVKCLRHEDVTIITTWMLNGKIAKKKNCWKKWKLKENEKWKTERIFTIFLDLKRKKSHS